MSNTSKKYFDEKLKNDIWNIFLKEISGVKSAKELQKVLEKFFTVNEINLLEKRLGVMHFLGKGLGYKDIGEIIDVMPRTISFIKNGLKRSKKSKRKENTKEKSSNENSFIYKKNSIMPTRVGKGRWHRR